MLNNYCVIVSCKGLIILLNAFCNLQSTVNLNNFTPYLKQ